MKQLLVMRHAKSPQEDGELADKDRPLDKRGRRDATRMGRELLDEDLVPDLVISSDAARTRETFERMSRGMGAEPEVEWREDFYLGGIQPVMARLRQLDSSHDRVLILGHNPGWQEVVMYLSSRPVRLTTANVALLERRAKNWQDALVEIGNWTLAEVLRPEELNE